MLLVSLLPITFPDLLSFCDSTLAVGLCTARSAYQRYPATATLCIAFYLSLFRQFSTFDVCWSLFVFGWGFSQDIDIDCFSSLMIFLSWLKLIAYSFLLVSLLPITFPDLLTFWDSTLVVGVCTARSAYQRYLAPVIFCIAFYLSLFMQLSTFDGCRSWFVFGWGFSRYIDIYCFSSLMIFNRGWS